jgi:hypothetical protein
MGRTRADEEVVSYKDKCGGGRSQIKALHINAGMAVKAEAQLQAYIVVSSDPSEQVPYV